MTLKQLSQIFLAALTLAISMQAQETAPTPQTIEEALHQLSDSAGIIFTGEVTAIRHRTGDNNFSGVVEIDFRIDQAIRGCSAGGTYTLREWAGLWSGGDERYRIGQRLLMLLHAPGLGGMTSPVGGMDGAIPIRGSATELFPQTSTTSMARISSTTISASAQTDTSATPTTPVADLRWIGTRVMRLTAYQTSTPHATTVATSSTAPGASQSSNVSDASTAAQQAPISVVLNMLAAWQEAPHATQ